MTEAFWPVFTSLGLSGCSSLVDDTQTQVKGKFSFSESTKCWVDEFVVTGLGFFHIYLYMCLWGLSNSDVMCVRFSVLNDNKRFTRLTQEKCSSKLQIGIKHNLLRKNKYMSTKTRQYWYNYHLWTLFKNHVNRHVVSNSDIWVQLIINIK